MAKHISNFLFVFGVTALIFLFSLVLLASAIFLFHGGESATDVWMAIAVAVVFVFIASRRYFTHYIFSSLFVLAALALVFAGSLFLSHRFYDISYDGQTYQQEAVIQLANGWNPVFQYLDPTKIGADQKWINYYPKSLWIIESYFYLFTHTLQAAKGLNIILIFIAVALLFAALTDAAMLGSFGALVVAILVACNPVVLSQSLSFYVDGDLYLLLVSFVALAISLYAKKRPMALAALFATISLFMNVKFTGFVDTGILLIVLVLVFVRQDDSQLFFRWFAVSAGAVAFAAIFIGASPYLTNLIRYQTPFYPLFGKGAIDLKPYNVPGNYIDKNPAEIFFLSFFARSGNVRGVGTVATYKVPFTYSSDELAAFRYPDPEEGGFGPLFGGVIILVLLGLIIGWLIEGRGKKRHTIFWYAWLSVIFIIITCVIDPISSLARYVPQAYLIAIVPVVALFMLKRPAATMFACALVVVIAVNNVLVVNSYVSYNTQSSEAIRTTLASLAARSQIQPIYIHFNEFKSNRIMFEEAGINYINVTDSDECVGGHAFLPENTTQLCSGITGASSSTTIVSGAK